MNHRYQQHPNFEIADALVKLPDGSFSSLEMANGYRKEWGTSPALNARPGRMKRCPVCDLRQPISEFLFDGGPVRTLERPLANGDVWAYVCADVREWCRACDEGVPR